MIEFVGSRKNAGGAVRYLFLVNGAQKELRQDALKRHPGCYEALPAAAQALIGAHRGWISKL